MSNNVAEIFPIVFNVETANKCLQKNIFKNAKKHFGKIFNLDVIPQTVYTMK